MATSLTARGPNANQPAKLPALQASRATDPHVRASIEALREWVEVRLGVRGDIYERAVLLREYSPKVQAIETRIKTLEDASTTDTSAADIIDLKAKVKQLRQDFDTEVTKTWAAIIELQNRRTGGSGAVSSVTLTQPGEGLTLTNSGVTQTGDVESVFVLANDIAALEALTGTGIPKRTGTDAWAIATPGTDYAKPDVASTWTAKQTFNGAATALAAKFANALEVATISATAATGTIAYNLVTQSVLYYTSNASANWTLNFRGDGSNSLNSLMATGECITCVFLVTQGSTAYFQATTQVDGSAVTPKWQGGTAPASGNASSIDAYSFSIIKTGSAAFTILAAQTKFA